MLKAACLLSLALLIVSACTTSPPPPTLPTLAVLPIRSERATATAVGVTETVLTPIPSLTRSPSPTDLRTATVAPSDTATSSPTDSSTPTNSPTDRSMPNATPLVPTATQAQATAFLVIFPSATPTSTGTLTPMITPSPSATALPVGDASISATSQQLVDLRGGPGFAYDPLMPLTTGTPLFLIGKSWDSQWYEVRLINGQEGWLYAPYLVIWADTSHLLVTFQQPTEPPKATVGSFALGGHVMDTTAAAFGLAHSAGMTWIKVQYRFYVGQNTNEVAAEIQAAHQNHFRILLGIVGDQGQMGDFGSYIASYASFVAEVAALGADAIEVWNEPNIDHEWPGNMISGANYTQLLAAAYTAIKARAPTTLVISAAPAPTGFFGVAGCGAGGCNDDIFLKQMAFAGAQNYLDCVGLHHNDGIVSPLQTSGDPRGDYPTNYLLGVISRVPPEFNSKPICFTEIGYLSPVGYGSLPGTFAWAQNTTVADQAQWLGDAVRVARSTGRVEMMIVWNINFTSYTATDPMAGYAILRPGGSCPACTTLAAAGG